MQKIKKNKNHTCVWPALIRYLVVSTIVIFANNITAQEFDFPDSIVNHRTDYYHDSIPELFRVAYSAINKFDTIHLNSILKYFLHKTPWCHDTILIIIIETYKAGGNALYGKIYSLYDTIDYMSFYPFSDSIKILTTPFLSDYSLEINNWNSMLANRSFFVSEIISWGGMLVTRALMSKIEIVAIETTGCYYHKSGSKIFFLKEKKEDNYAIRPNTTD